MLLSTVNITHFDFDAGAMQRLGCWVDERVGPGDNPPSSMDRPQPAMHMPARVSLLPSRLPGALHARMDQYK